MRALAFLGALVTLLVPSAATSQTPYVAGGMWWEVGAAAGGARLSCPVCDPARGLGPALNAAIGAYASPRLRLGLDGGAWSNEDGGDRENVYRAGLVTQLHPNPNSGLHLIAGLGWSGYRADGFTYDGVRLSLGAGWDLPLTASWAVGNRVTLDASSWASLKNDGTVAAPSVGLSVVEFGIYLRKR